MNKRAHNGRFISRNEVGRRELHKLLAFILFPIVFGALSHYANTPIVFDSGWNPKSADAYTMSDEELCSLRAIVCEDEEPAQKAIQAVSEALGHEVTDETKRRIKYLYERSMEHGVPFYDAVKTIYCESMWYAQKSHLPEESYGIAQIHLPSHGITREQAMDAYFAIDFLVDRWGDTVWYGYNRETGTCTNGLRINL